MSTTQDSTEKKTEPKADIPKSLVLSIGKEFYVPFSIKTNVWSFEMEDGEVRLHGVIFKDPIAIGDDLILVSSLAPVFGFYNPERGLLSAAHGKPKLMQARRVKVEHVGKVYAITGSHYYEEIEVSDDGEYKP